MEDKQEGSKKKRKMKGLDGDDQKERRKEGKNGGSDLEGNNQEKRLKEGKEELLVDGVSGDKTSSSNNKPPKIYDLASNVIDSILSKP
ncbi:hypothetical protein M5689_020223 [Euphorbia peplus]|nr:hypothetical protein M5689_020223 [Euphorbia peplus]